MKKILLILVVLAAIGLSLSVATAGDSTSGATTVHAKVINATITHEDITVRDSSSIGAYKVIDDGSSENQPGYEIDAIITLDVSNASDEFKQTLNDIASGKGENGSYSVWADANITTDNEDLNDLDYSGSLSSYDNKTAVIHLTKTVVADDFTNPLDGDVPIKNGTFVIYILGSDDKNVTITF